MNHCRPIITTGPFKLGANFKPLSEPMLTHCQLDPWENFNGNWIKIYKKMNLKMWSQKWRPFSRPQCDDKCYFQYNTLVSSCELAGLNEAWQPASWPFCLLCMETVCTHSWVYHAGTKRWMHSIRPPWCTELLAYGRTVGMSIQDMITKTMTRVTWGRPRSHAS